MAVSDKVQGIIDQINGLNVLELAELSKSLQEAWGVTAAAQVAVAAPGAAADGAAGGAAAAPAEEQSEFNVVLTDFGANKINVIKAVREGVPKEEADAAAAKLREAGATVEVK